MTSSIIDYTDAVDRLATLIANKNDFVILTPPSALRTLAGRLTHIPTGWTAYLADGSSSIALIDNPAAILLAALHPGDIVAVVTVPKTTPAQILSEILDHPIPEDGTRDLIMLTTDEIGPVCWPMLFVHALEQVDPIAAISIHNATGEYR